MVLFPDTVEDLPRAVHWQVWLHPFSVVQSDPRPSCPWDRADACYLVSSLPMLMPDYIYGKFLPLLNHQTPCWPRMAVKNNPGSAFPTSPAGVLFATGNRGSHLGHEHGEWRTTTLRQLLIIGARSNAPSSMSSPNAMNSSAEAAS